MLMPMSSARSTPTNEQGDNFGYMHRSCNDLEIEISDANVLFAWVIMHAFTKNMFSPAAIVYFYSHEIRGVKCFVSSRSALVRRNLNASINFLRNKCRKECYLKTPIKCGNVYCTRDGDTENGKWKLCQMPNFSSPANGGSHKDADVSAFAELCFSTGWWRFTKSDW